MVRNVSKLSSCESQNFLGFLLHVTSFVTRHGRRSIVFLHFINAFLYLMGFVIHQAEQLTEIQRMS